MSFKFGNSHVVFILRRVSPHVISSQQFRYRGVKAEKNHQITVFSNRDEVDVIVQADVAVYPGTMTRTGDMTS